ncbi:MAG: DUF481 domain-containing protein [Candidatus Eisenbacteria bacterium]|uniref:DUF481 domain-containing protein n=1 Tax=Eiseniibacteriota bacterium TaxID=2212470 RepID=A0A956NKC8_UNCEI|nr:DUF481 domain-containing protein [Candidatus Eisenbacteria bacterium]
MSTRCNISRTAIHASAFPLLLCLLVGLATPASAQIVNTIRSFDADDLGWTGSLEARFSQSGGNTDVLTFGGGGTVQWMSDAQRVRLLAKAARSENDGKKIADASMAHLRHNYRFTPRIASLLFTQVQRNPFQRLRSRLLIGAGARFDLVTREEWSLFGGVAHMYEREEIEADASGAAARSEAEELRRGAAARSGAEGSVAATIADGTRTDVDHRASVFISWSGDLKDGVSVDLSGFYQPLWSDFADVRATASGELLVAIVGSLSLGLEGSVTQDSEPPAGVKETDWSYLTKLVVEF